jgi:hypothetical protein
MAVVGVLAGVAWYWAVDLPSYRLGNDFYALIDEWGESQIFGADVWLAAIGVLAGGLLGFLAWFLFRRFSWLSAVLAALGALGAGLAAELTGRWLGPSGFDERLAEAQPGVDTVIPVDLASHTPVYLAVWVASATLLVLIAAIVAPGDSVWHQLEDPTDQPAQTD